MASATAITAVKLAGVAYRVRLGVGSLLAAGRRERRPEIGGLPPRPLREIFVDGVVLNVLNPKTAVFVLGSFPSSSTRTLPDH